MSDDVDAVDIPDAERGRYSRPARGDTVVTLEYRRDPLWGDRWSLVYQGRSVITAPSEAEARESAKGHGWTVDERERRALG